MLEEAITGRRIDVVPHLKEFERRRSRLTSAEFDAVLDALTLKLEETPVGKSISASWIPGADWTGTVYMPLYAKACGHDFVAAALFFGSVMKWAVIHHDSHWRSNKQPKAKNDPDSVYWRVD
jgi:hypothetical protein